MSADDRAQAQPPWVARLPEQVSMALVDLAMAETQRRRKVLTRTHRGEDAAWIAGDMALAQAYQFIEHLVSKLEDAEGRIRELEREANAAWDVDAS